MDGGLQCLQLLCVILSYVFVHADDASIPKLSSLLQSHGYAVSDVQNVLREMIANMDNDVKAIKQREMLVQWNAIVSRKTSK